MESEDALERLLGESGIKPESQAARHLISYFALLKKWNLRINLTADTDWPAVGPLFQEGIWVSGFYPDESDDHLDIGSGAGFPAILIRILVPRIRLEIVESRAKKAAFLETVVSDLGLAGTRVHRARLDEHLRKSERIWDCITWKGLKLSSKDLLQLRAHAHSRTQFWVFHGRELAVENTETMSRNFRHMRSEKCPGRRDWMLSIYLPR